MSIGTCPDCGEWMCNWNCKTYIDWLRNREPRRKKPMSDLGPHDKSMIDAFSTCAAALADVPEHLRQRVIKALQAMFPDKPAVANQPLPQGWQSGGMQGGGLICPKYGGQ